jgi:hypothetical protein
MSIERARFTLVAALGEVGGIFGLLSLLLG